MTHFSPRLAAFAAQLEVAPDEAAQVIYQYCLAMLLVEEGLAQLVRIEIHGREPWCIFRTSGGNFTLLRPFLSQVEERRMIETVRQVIPRQRFALAEEVNWLITSHPLLGEVDSAEEFSWPEDIAAAAPDSQAGAAPALPMPETTLKNKAEASLRAAELRQVVEQAQTAAASLRALMVEVRQATVEARAAAAQNRSILAQMQNAVRQYQRRVGEPELPRQMRPMQERDKQITLAVLEGLTWVEAGRKFGISYSRAKKIYITQFHRLHRLERVLGLSGQDVEAIKKHERPYFGQGGRPHAERMKELLEKMWAYEENS